jgi:hypothetical protein
LASVAIDIDIIDTRFDCSEIIQLIQHRFFFQSDHDDKNWKHPGELGQVSAWAKRSKRGLKMQRKVGYTTGSCNASPRYINISGPLYKKAYIRHESGV